MTRPVCFRSITVVDFEYEVSDGDLPKVLCMVAHTLDSELRHVASTRLWRGDFGSRPPFDIGPDSLIVGYSLWAEMTCFMTLGWRFPVHLFDQHTAYLATSNILLPYNPDEKRVKPRKRLSDACKAYGVPGWDAIDKEKISQDIGEGRWQLHGREAVFRYCEEDVRTSTELLRRQVRGHGSRPPVDTHEVLHWSNYSGKAVARIQARGMPIDMPLWNMVQENKALVVDALLRRFDPSYGAGDSIYSPEGEWSYYRFEQWLIRAGVTAWPRLQSGELEIDGDAFRMMYGAHPAIEGLHALRDSLGVIVRARIPIGRDGRNRPSLFPFGTATGRNAQAKSLFNAHAAMRSFMKFPADRIAVYLDWRTQEIGVAAARSGDAALMESYRSGDIYHSLAMLCGLTDDRNIKRWKHDCADQRQRMKALQLGISYGMGVRSLSRGLDRHPLIGSEVIIRHKARYARFWEWRADMVQTAMLEREIKSEHDGWPLHISTSPNKRTLYNFPMQSGGAEMLRLASCRLCDAGLVPSMLVHDGILLELLNQDQVEQAIEIMRVAGAETCDGFEIGVDIDQRLEGGARYRDKRDVAQKMWAVVMDVLAEIGALSEVTDETKIQSFKRSPDTIGGFPVFRDRPDPESPLATVSVPALAYLEGELMDAKVSFLQRARSTRAAPPSKPASRPPATKAAQGPQFVMTSREQARRLMQVSNATRPVFERLQFLAPYGKAQGKAFELPDATTFGFSRDQRSRALTELKKCGLISVKDRPGQSPLITMLWEYKK